MLTYAFWNNKGGTGKTSLNFQTILMYAKRHPDERVLAMDLCPQANLSELLLGGLVGTGSQSLLEIHARDPRPSVGGYFQMRLPNPYQAPDFDPTTYLVKPSDFNQNAQPNVDLLPGDPLLELQATAVSTLANTQIPGQNTWLSIVDWLHDFVAKLGATYDVVFVDCNPSFSISPRSLCR
ncbi:MAG: AAA family ATPase [Myxococcota bacterium]